MNNKGFTLVELLATVVLVSLVMGIASYGVINAINNSKKKSEDIFVKKFVQAIDSYLALNGPKSSEVEDGDIVLSDGSVLKQLGPFKLSDLGEENFIDKDKFINPKNKKNCYKADNEIYVFRNSKFVYYYFISLKNLDCGISEKNIIKYQTNLPNDPNVLKFINEKNGVVVEEDNNEVEEELNKVVNLSLGSYVSYTPSETSYTTDTSKTGYSSAQTINPSELNLWRVLKTNSDGSVEIISEYVSSLTIWFTGQVGYQNFAGYLNFLAKQYENPTYTSGSRYFGYNGQTQYITDTSKFVNPPPWTCSTGGNCSPNPGDYESSGGGEDLYLTDYNLVNTVLGTNIAYKVGTSTASEYWLPSRNYVYDVYSSPINLYWRVRIVSTYGSYASYSLYRYDGSSFRNLNSRAALRPIVILKSGLVCSSGDGSQGSPCSVGGTVG